MATRTRTGVWISPAILERGWDDTTLAALVRLLAYLARGRETRRLGTPVHRRLPPAAVCEVAGTTAAVAAYRILLGLPRASGLDFTVREEESGELLVLWRLTLALPPEPLERGGRR